MDISEKLKILTAAAKYDVACTSSGVDRDNSMGGLGNSAACGICHSFSSDGRCISLLKILLSNVCSYDCQYCVNRKSNDLPRATFTPEEVADLTINFYRRNYIEGLFLSSAVVKDADYTSELLLKALSLLRFKYRFNGYIHVKAIPGASQTLINQLGMLADRMSINIELPSNDSLQKLAPDKSKHSIFAPMQKIQTGIKENKSEIVKYKKAPKFVPAGQSTQMIIGASPESDLQIIRLTEGLYNKYSLKRVFFSAYMPVADNPLLPSLDTKPPLLREHRLYQADWLLRFYGFKANELLDEKNQNFNPLIDPKCFWALNHPEIFPVEVNKAPYEVLLRVPGIGVKSARTIVTARRKSKLDFMSLKKIGVVLKRAQFFITCEGKASDNISLCNDDIMRGLLSDNAMKKLNSDKFEQITLLAKEEQNWLPIQA